MTYAERQEIFSKEYITTKELAELLGIAYTKASTLLQTIKRKTGDRLGIKGKIHIQDYLDYYHLDGSSQRYSMELQGEDETW